MRYMIIMAATAATLAATTEAALADQCTTMMATTTTMCGSFVYNAIPNNKFTITFGPGSSFSGVGASSETRGLTWTGNYACAGNNFYTTQYSVSDGEQNYWIARFPNTIVGSGSSGVYASGKLKAGACH